MQNLNNLSQADGFVFDGPVSGGQSSNSEQRTTTTTESTRTSTTTTTTIPLFDDQFNDCVTSCPVIIMLFPKNIKLFLTKNKCII